MDGARKVVPIRGTDDLHKTAHDVGWMHALCVGTRVRVRSWQRLGFLNRSLAWDKTPVVERQKVTRSGEHNGERSVCVSVITEQPGGRKLRTRAAEMAESHENASQ
ncbi:hypothetical protein PHLCEN_2v1335 [Hermanssonia centrifuga]|uniref:Uncharacterized protein n=1 Tax=Hermanssonia centrifuga TaxID=98765 RepID=A0A2R6S3D9_9APHY|nr:hypothetical protein PHLCEN_2v1335 [Hermanssonia centrifuga]